MLKRLELWWNARTPVWLHNGTKENIIFQLSGLVLFILGFHAKDWWERRQWDKNYRINPEN
jgi:hypothetical protein